MPRKKMIWEVLTTDNASVGSYIKCGRGYSSFKGKLTQTTNGIQAEGQYRKWRDKLCFKNLNNPAFNHEYGRTIHLYVKYTGVILADNGNRVWISIVELPENKRTKRCTNCNKKGALFTKGLCKACNLLAF